jgi:transcriptional regulator with XRE-family HTH domain
VRSGLPITRGICWLAAARALRPRVLTGSQIRAGRALLKWSEAALAAQSGVSESTIRRAKRVDGMTKMSTDNLLKLQRVLEEAGVTFVEPGEVSGGVGVALRAGS